MDELSAYVESAYAVRRAVMAEQKLREVAEKQAQAEKEALQLLKLQTLVESIVPEPLRGHVHYPAGRDLFGNLRVQLWAPGCVPVEMIVYCGARELDYFLPGDGEYPWLVPSIWIQRPSIDEDDGELYEGRTEWSWGHAPKPYDWCYARSCNEAIGHARERWLVLAEAEAENKRLYDALVLKQREKLAVTPDEQAIAEYVPLIDDVSPAHVFNQALREYVFDLVDERVRAGRE